MTEFIIMWGIPLLFLLLSGQSPFFQNWRFLVTLTFGFYLAVGFSSMTISMSALWIPKEFSKYSAAASILISALLFSIAVFRIMAAVTSHGNGGYHLPQQKNVLIQACGFLSGYVFSALVGLVLIASPLQQLIKSESFPSRMLGRICIVTGFVDKLSLQGISGKQRRQKLERLIKPFAKQAGKKQPAPKTVPAPPQKTEADLQAETVERSILNAQNQSAQNQSAAPAAAEINSQTD